ncbi:hypothetical protein REPUB_Repub05bG0080400 [Reevesia pubescens]
MSCKGVPFVGLGVNSFSRVNIVARMKASWLCPGKNTLKFNTDGSVAGNSMVPGMGGVLRDFVGNVHGIFYGPLARDSQVIIAELNATCNALKLFSSSCWVGKVFLIVESDLKTAVSWICHKDSRPWKEWCLFAEIDHLLDTINKWTSCIIFGKQIPFVDSLARLGSSSSRLFHAWL